MDVLHPTRCHHCLKDGHWAKDCPLLVGAENLKQHLARIEQIRDRFLYEDLAPHDKQRMIAKENELWREKKKELSRK